MFRVFGEFRFSERFLIEIRRCFLLIFLWFLVSFGIWFFLDVVFRFVGGRWVSF